MPKLYYTPTSCGAASFISAYVAGLSLEAETVNIGTHVTASGADFYAINPKGNVPTIVDGKTVLNENVATLSYIASLAPGKVAPLPGTPEYFEVVNWLAWTASEYHASVGSLFNPKVKGDATLLAFSLDKLHSKLAYLDKSLEGKSFLVGSSFSVADAYQYITLSWSPYVGVDLSKYANVSAYFEGIKSLPKVVEAHARIATDPSTTI